MLKIIDVDKLKEAAEQAEDRAGSVQRQLDGIEEIILILIRKHYTMDDIRTFFLSHDMLLPKTRLTQKIKEIKMQNNLYTEPELKRNQKLSVMAKERASKKREEQKQLVKEAVKEAVEESR